MNIKQKKQIIKLQFVVGLITIVLLSLTLMVTQIVAYPGTAQESAQDGAEDPRVQAIIGLGLGAGLAIGLAGLGAALALGTASSAAIGAIAERPEVFGRTIIFIAFIEGIGVFGFVIAFMLYLAIGQMIA